MRAQDEANRKRKTDYEREHLNPKGKMVTLFVVTKSREAQYAGANSIYITVPKSRD